MSIRNIVHTLLMAACCAAPPAQAEVKEYIRDYNYHGAGFDTAATCRANAIDGVKRELLEEIGTYVGSVVKLHQDSLGNSYMSHDVVNFTAGIVAMRVLDEKWKQPVYFVRAGMKADPDDVLAKLKALRADLELERSLRESYEELQNSRNEVAKLKAQIEQLRLARDTQAPARSTDPAMAPAVVSAPAVDDLVARYVQAVQDVEVGAAFQRAMAARMNGDFAALFREMSALAEKGYAKAQFRMGWIYERGIGVAQDYSRRAYGMQRRWRTAPPLPLPERGCCTNWGWVSRKATTRRPNITGVPSVKAMAWAMHTWAISTRPARACRVTGSRQRNITVSVWKRAIIWP